MSQDKFPHIECHYLVVGGGIAGVSCVDHLYTLGDIENRGLKVILISISDYLKEGKVKCHLTKTLEEIVPVMKCWDGIFGKYKTFTFISGCLIEIHPKKYEVVVERKKTDNMCSSVSYINIGYRKLIICTGASPKTLSVPVDGAITLRDEDSAIRLMEALKKYNNICIAGNGGIALELIYALKHCALTWVVRDKSIGNAYFDEATSIFLYDHIKQSVMKKDNISTGSNSSKNDNCLDNQLLKPEEFSKYVHEKFGHSLGPNWYKQIDFEKIANNHFEKSVNIKLNSEIKRVVINKENSQYKYTVLLSNGELFQTDVIILAIGVVPNTQFTIYDDEKLDKDDIGALKVNHLMETSLKDVYAAGDCCSVNISTDYEYDGIINENCWFQKRLWSQAKFMGQRAAEIVIQPKLTPILSMVPIQFEIFSHFMRIFGLTAIMLGKYNIFKDTKESIEFLLRINKEKSEYIRCVIANNCMVGAIMIGKHDETFELAETFENLILNKTNLSTLKEYILNPNIDIADYFD